jgi:hypothetical protein
MNQRGRKSAAALSVARDTHISLRPSPPADLTPLQRGYWLEIANSLPAEWFGDDNKALLGEYARTLSTLAFLNAQIDELEKKDSQEVEVKLYLELVKRRESLARTQLTQATKMRLTQQSRYRADKAATLTQDRSPKAMPWQFEG